MLDVSQLKSQTEVFNLWQKQTGPLKNRRMGFLHQKIDITRLLENAFSIDSCRFSNSWFYHQALNVLETYTTNGQVERKAANFDPCVKDMIRHNFRKT